MSLTFRERWFRLLTRLGIAPGRDPQTPVRDPGALLAAGLGEARATSETIQRMRQSARPDVGRLTTDRSQSTLMAPLFAILPPPGVQDHWQYGQLDDADLTRINPFRLAELLTNLSPEISRANWDYLRLCNNGYELHAIDPVTREPVEAGEQVIAEIEARLTTLYGSCDVIWNRLFNGQFMRGMALGEAVFGADGETLIDLAVPDTASIRFELRVDPIRGTYYQIGQLQAGKFVVLDRPTIRWVPLDPLPGQPYGRPMVAPALYTSVFLLGLMHELRRVITMQGYPRYDIEVVLEKVKASAPPEIQMNPAKFKEWVEGMIAEVQEAYNLLAVDDAFIHTDNVHFNPPVGALADGRAFQQLDSLIGRIEGACTRALKSVPILMGIAEGASEAQANRQWELMAAGIKAVQHGIENLGAGLFTLALQAKGIPAVAELRFAELRIAELLRDAQVEALDMQNAATAYDRGWISQDEAAERTVGHPPDQEEPRVSAAGGGSPFDNIGNPDPGSNRLRRGQRDRTRAFTPKAGPKPAKLTAAVSTADLRKASDDWDATVDEPYPGLLDAAVVDGD